jgi:hypothetical protein
MQPICDESFVTVIFERRHDVVLAKVQITLAYMKTTISTLTCNSTLSAQAKPGQLSNRVALFRRRLHSLFSARGFSFGIFPMVGAFQYKEVVITNEGQYFLGSKSQSNYFKKEF